MRGPGHIWDPNGKYKETMGQAEVNKERFLGRDVLEEISLKRTIKNKRWALLMKKKAIILIWLNMNHTSEPNNW